MTRPKAYIDFEYNTTNAAKFNLVSCCLLVEGKYFDFWLHDAGRTKENLKCVLLDLRDSYVFVSYNVVAEARSFISLGLDPTKFTWIDLETEWKMLINHYNKFAYGDQLIDGQVRRTKPPLSKYEATEEQRKQADNSKAPRNLIGACYKLTGIRLDQDVKDDTRDLILSAPVDFTSEEQKKILAYGRSDVEVLPCMLSAILEAYQKSPAKKAIKVSHMFWRGETSARTALIQAYGYPVNRKRAEAFRDAVPDILKDLAEDLIEQFPSDPPFRWNKGAKSYSRRLVAARKFIQSCPFVESWQKTDKGQLSLSLDAWTQHYSYSHDYPRGNFAAQYIRFLKTQQSLNGFMPKKATTKETFFDCLGSDDRARSYLNPYGSQSSRFQPKATGFIPLKSAWMRSLIEPRSGKMLVGIDYASQEFLIAAILSEDETMFEAYASGDPYIYLAKLAGAAPPEATKHTHPEIREPFKSTTLGISYLMGAQSLAAKITRDTGKEYTSLQAQKLINIFFKAYKGYKRWIDKTVKDYELDDYLQLVDGWVMFGDNDNVRSISNCPIQGTGACILRKAIQLCQDEKLRIIIPLHDALYFEFDAFDFASVLKAKKLMREAFCYYFTGRQRDWAGAVRSDINAWGPGLADGTHEYQNEKIKTQSIYIDPRSKNEYERFSKYFA